MRKMQTEPTPADILCPRPHAPDPCACWNPPHISLGLSQRALLLGLLALLRAHPLCPAVCRQNPLSDAAKVELRQHWLDSGRPLSAGDNSCRLEL